MKRDVATKSLLAALTFLLFSIYITFPLILHLGNYTTGFGDELVIAWIQNTVIHALFTHPLQLFQGNILYPFHNTVAFSDLMLPTSLLAAIPLKLVQEPISTVNFTFISSLFLLGMSVWTLSYYLTKNFFASILAGCLVIFSPAVLDKKVHLQILSIYFVPFATTALLHYVKTKRTIFFGLFLVLFVLQTLNSFLPGYFILVFFLSFMGYLSYKKFPLKSLFLNKKVIFLTIFSLVILSPFIAPYLQVSREYEAKRDIRDAIHFALQPEDFLYPGEHTRLNKPLLALSESMEYSPEASLKPGFLGATFTVLSLMAVFFFFKFKSRSEATPILITSFIGFILSLGPFLHFGRVTIHHPFPIPLPYALFYYIAPGFQGFRNSARWEMLMIIFMAVLVAWFMSMVSKKINPQNFLLIIVILSLTSALEFPFPMRFSRIEPVKSAAIHQYIKTLPNKPLVFLPISSWNMAHPEEEIRREYYSTVHYHKMLNGYTGFTPSKWQGLAENLERDFPDLESVQNLRNIGISYLIIDTKLYDMRKNGFSSEVEEKLAEIALTKKIKEVDGYIVYSIK